MRKLTNIWQFIKWTSCRHPGRYAGFITVVLNFILISIYGKLALAINIVIVVGGGIFALACIIINMVIVKPIKSEYAEYIKTKQEMFAKLRD
jgi:hypothetical protein